MRVADASVTDMSASLSPDGPGIPALVGARIRAARKTAGLTQEQLAARVGLTRSAIGNLEAGTQDTSMTRLADIAAVLDLDLSGLFGRKQAA